MIGQFVSGPLNYAREMPGIPTIFMDNGHSKYHSKNAFCGYAGPEELKHLHDLVSELSDEELKQLVENCGINFIANPDVLDREDYEGVIEEADREDFYREYRKLVKQSKTKQ